MRAEVAMADRRQQSSEKKEYFPPKIVQTEKMAARAVVCAKADDTSCGAGPIQS